MRGRRCKLTRAEPPESEPLLEKTPIAIRATLFDKYSNQLDHGGVRVDAKASGVGVSGAKVEDNKDGTYAIRYKFKLAKTFTIGITVNNGTAAWLDENNKTTTTGSTSIDPAPASGSSCKAGGTGLNSTIKLGAGAETTFTIFAVDEFGNAIKEGDYDWTVVLTTIDAETGKTVNPNARGEVSADPQGAQFPWVPPAVAGLESPEGINE